MRVALAVLAGIGLWLSATVVAAVVLGKRLEGRAGIDRNRFGDVIDEHSTPGGPMTDVPVQPEPDDPDDPTEPEGDD